MRTNEVVLLLSGGIDSTTLLAQLIQDGKRVHALSFNYGQRHAAELEYAKMNAKKYGVVRHHIITLDLNAINLSSALFSTGPTPVTYESEPLPSKPTTDYVPGRNMMMLSHAAAYAEAHSLSEINFAANGDDADCFPDCRAEFIQALSGVWGSTVNTRALRLRTPFISIHKHQVVELAWQLNVDLEDTLSCYAPIGRQVCGKCFSCKKREDAINRAAS
jgi:7-cyano-7-deazaguanine synthase